ncbi:hypothetical protein [Streptomyces lichenis]|uniref:Uncharacterized protein n=1 Tax=Streptomyces lichenis TaxID=2306967 RepID=A0ABT0I463_9ACTN|nr:hypothetical protein [Streptomyces lichenis]MCK8676116.1 hypothetical protein [Streptomyces lichenis]
MTSALLALLVVAAALVAAQPAGAAAALPGGKAHWVVAVGGLDTSAKTNFRNWVRIGYYTFAPDSTVTTSFWNWNQRDQPMRADTMEADCGGTVPRCPIRTVEGFTGAPSGGFRGSYTYASDGRLTVTWTGDEAGNPLAEPLTEHWTVEGALAGGTAARMLSPTFYGPVLTERVPVPAPGAFSSYTATFGIGYGSNAALDRESRAAMKDLVTDARYNSRTYKGAFVVAKGNGDRKTGVVGREQTGGDWSFGGPQGWRLCGSAPCMGYLQHPTGCDDPLNKNRVRYLAEVGGGRRNTEEYWCQGLAQKATCYPYNSHPRPLLQVVDDAGRFQGWVGAEAFTEVDTRTNRPTGTWAAGYWGVFDMVSADLKPRLPVDQKPPAGR